MQIVITDLEMPKMDGLELCKRLKGITKKLPVVIVSSLVSSRLSKQGDDAGADKCLGKDELGGLLEVIAELVAK